MRLRRRVKREGLALIAGQGYERTTFDDVARAAGTTPAGFAEVYGSLEDLVADDDGLDDLVAAVMAVRAADEPLMTMLRVAALAVGTRVEGARASSRRAG